MENNKNHWYYKLNGTLVKEKKLCLPGDLVHIKTFKGLYKVEYVYVDCFVVMKKRQLINIPWEDFKCLKGEGNSPHSSIKKEIKSSLYLMQLQNSVNQSMIDRLNGMLKSLKNRL